MDTATNYLIGCLNTKVKDNKYGPNSIVPIYVLTVTKRCRGYESVQDRYFIILIKKKKDNKVFHYKMKKKKIIK